MAFNIEIIRKWTDQNAAGKDVEMIEYTTQNGTSVNSIAAAKQLASWPAISLALGKYDESHQPKRKK